MPYPHRTSTVLGSVVCAILSASCQGAGQSAAAPIYALGVSSGQCPPDVAFYHAMPGDARTELGVVASPGNTVAYSLQSRHPRFDGRGDAFTVRDGSNGHTFVVNVPISAITTILVSASGVREELAGKCVAVPL